MGYTQSPHLTVREIETLLETAQIARLCTHNDDGTIHAVPVWFFYVDRQIVVFAPERSRKVRNLTCDSRVTLLIDDSLTPGVPPKGVVIYGTAKVSAVPLTVDEAGLRLEKYFSPEQAAP